MTSNPAPSDPTVLLRHRQFVYGLALELLRDPTDAEDVSQETFAVALERSPRDPRKTEGVARQHRAAICR
jgi:DNA-directed RNA polymerase specialized sigma24 family protein